jgi:hypothetical protein
VRIFGRKQQPQAGALWAPPGSQRQSAPIGWQLSAPTREGDLPIQLAFVIVGDLVINAGVYIGYPRSSGEWADGLRLDDPESGGLHYREDDYREEWLAAGIRDIAVVGLPYHPDAQCPEFGVGQYVSLVPEPTNKKDRRAIAIRSADRRRLAGYVPKDRLDELWSMRPTPQTGIVAWDNYIGPPRERVGLYVIAAPTIELRVVPFQQAETERARREWVYGARERARLQKIEEREAAKRAAAVEWERARAAEHERVREAKTAKAELEADRREAGVCLDCGGRIEPHTGRGRPPARCEHCRTSASK